MADTVPGGRYLGPDGKLHDANGNPIKGGAEGDVEESTAKPVAPKKKK